MPKIAIIGHGGCGKDTVAEFITHLTGLTLTGSCSWHLRHYVSERLGLLDVNAAYADRRNRRAEWREAIDAYREGDPGRIVREMFEVGDIATGVRARIEFEGARHLMDLVIWVERPGTPPDATCDLTSADADVVILNDSSLAVLEARVSRRLAVFFVKDMCSDMCRHVQRVVSILRKALTSSILSCAKQYRL